MQQKSKNVLLCKLVLCSQAFASGLWNNGTLSPYLFLLTNNSKTAVGLVQGLSGLAAVLMALPVGHLSDKTQRHYVARFSACLDAAVVVAIAAVTSTGRFQFHAFLLAAVLWGSSSACDSSLDALFADSIPTGSRSREFTHLLALSRACLGAGPLIAALLFHFSGNTWSLHALAIVILCGMAAAVLPLCLKLAVHDTHTLGLASEAHACTATAPLLPAASPCATSRPNGNTSAVSVLCSSSTGSPPNSSTCGPVAGTAPPSCAQSASPSCSDDDASESAALLRTTAAAAPMDLSFWVPLLLSLSDVTSGLAAGCTIKFFPIFFMDEVHLKPVQSSFLFASMPVGIALGMLSAQRTAACMGRVPAIVMYKCLAAALLTLMALDTRLWAIKWLIVPIYLVRTCAANCTRAVARSVLMDFVPKALRGRWSSVDSITAFGWSGSALLGGFLVDKHGFAPVFLATAAMQLAATLSFTAPLLFLIPRFEARLSSSGDAAGGFADAGAAGSQERRQEASCSAGAHADDEESAACLLADLDVRSSVDRLRSE